ncbi:hypothetical protein ZEAMMB73_Zm00001d040058 [Zea mays]|uniref:cellulase n=1 Tax=Zea mays TaxID=4577 RepID=A0A1D6MMV5_MAIZE|nr:hypothetical protein ZEAMMB73_Zm00001d040058 [Zea mays]
MEAAAVVQKLAEPVVPLHLTMELVQRGPVDIEANNYSVLDDVAPSLAPSILQLAVHAEEEQVLVTTPTKCSTMDLNRGAYSVPNLPVVCIVGGPNSNEYGTNRVLHHTIGIPRGGSGPRATWAVARGAAQNSATEHPGLLPGAPGLPGYHLLPGHHQQLARDLYVKCGTVELTRHAFDRMPERHLASWNAMALALANHGRGKDSLDLFNRMTRVENVRHVDMTTSRRAYEVDADHPGSEVAAVMAAATAVFHWAGDAHYAHLLLHHAQQLFDFANTYRDTTTPRCRCSGESIGVNKIHVKPQFFDVGKDYNWARGIRSTEIQLADGKNCELHRCWADILDAISKAQHSTDITGWLTILVRDDSNSVDLLTKEGLLTTHDVEIAKGEQEIMNEVFPAESRSSGFGVAMDLPDIWPCYESKPSDAQGYAVKGIPNLRNTCYRSAVLQCLFMLGKLLERILTSTWRHHQSSDDDSEKDKVKSRHGKPLRSSDEDAKSDSNRHQMVELLMNQRRLEMAKGRTRMATDTTIKDIIPWFFFPKVWAQLNIPAIIEPQFSR